MKFGELIFPDTCSKEKGRGKRRGSGCKCWSLSMLTVVFFFFIWFFTGLALSGTLTVYNSINVLNGIRSQHVLRQRIMQEEIWKLFSKGPSTAEYIVERMEFRAKYSNNRLADVRVNYLELYNMFYALSLNTYLRVLWFCEFSHDVNGTGDNLAILDRTPTPGVFVVGYDQTIHINFLRDSTSFVNPNISRPYQGPTGPNSRIPWLYAVVEAAEDPQRRDDVIWGQLSKYPKLDDDIFYFSITCMKGYYENGRLSGVIDVAISLETLEETVRSLDLGQDELVYVINEEFALLAVSNEENDEKYSATPINALHASDSIIRESASWLMNISNGEIATLVTNASLGSHFVDSKHRNHLVEVFRVVHSYNLNVFAVYTIPKTVFYRPVMFCVFSSFAISMSLMVVFAVVGLVLSFLFISPFHKLKSNLRRISKLDFSLSVKTSWKTLDEFRDLNESLHKTKRALQLIERFLPLDVVKMSLEQNKHLFLQPERITVAFIDLNNFTTISEKFDSRLNLLVEFLSDFFGTTSRIVRQYKGTIDKYIGDEVMFFFNAPRKIPRHKIACVELQTLREKWKFADLPVEIHGSVNTGICLVGLFGSDERINYSVLGDVVNTCQRLQSLNKYYGTDILIGENTFEGVKEKYSAFWVDMVVLKGKSKPVEIYHPREKLVSATFEILSQEKLFREAREGLVERNAEKVIDCYSRIIERGSQKEEGVDGTFSTSSEAQIAEAMKRRVEEKIGGRIDTSPLLTSPLFHKVNFK